MKIDATRYAKLHGLMRARGLPSQLLRASGEVSRRDISACTHADTRPVTIKRQEQDLTSSMRGVTGDWLLVIGTKLDQDLMILLGLEYFARCTLAQMDDPTRTARPYWHVVTGGWGDRMRDDGRKDHEWRASLGPIGALVISNISADCTNDKLEKVRDLVHLHAGVPRVLLVYGGDPWQFSIDRLHRKPDRVVHVNRTRARADKDLSS